MAAHSDCELTDGSTSLRQPSAASSGHLKRTGLHLPLPSVVAALACYPNLAHSSSCDSHAQSGRFLILRLSSLRLFRLHAVPLQPLFARRQQRERDDGHGEQHQRQMRHDERSWRVAGWLDGGSLGRRLSRTAAEGRRWLSWWPRVGEPRAQWTADSDAHGHSEGEEGEAMAERRGADGCRLF